MRLGTRFYQAFIAAVVILGVVVTAWATTTTYQYKDNLSNTFNIQLYQCTVTPTYCTSMVLEDSAGNEKFVATNPGQVAITNTGTIPVNITSLTQTVTVSGTGAQAVNCVQGCSGSGQSQLTSPIAVVLNTPTQASLPVNITSLTETVTVSSTGAAAVNCVAGCSGAGQSQLTNPLAFVLNTPTQASLPVNVTSLTETVTVTPTNGSIFVQTPTNGSIFVTTPTNGAQVVTASSAWIITPTTGVFSITPTGPLATALAITTATELGFASTSEPATQTTGNTRIQFLDDVGKIINSPFANRENYLQAAITLATNSASSTLFSAQGAGLKVYVTGLQCGRTDAGTTAAFVTFTDGLTITPTIVLPNNGGGGGNDISLNTPFSFAANTTVSIGTSASLTTVYCTAQGYKGY